MENAIETIEYKNHFIKIYEDEDPGNPREWDNLGILLTHHRDYNFNLGEFDRDITQEFDCEYQSKAEIEKDIIKRYNPLIMAPVYLYDHSGLRLKIGSFQNCGLPQGHAEFDTSHIGYILATKEQVKKEWNVKRISKKLKQTVMNNLESEIDALDKYVSGQVYGYSVDNGDLDSCWGYYDYNQLLEDAKSSIDYHIEQKRKSKQNKLKVLIRNKVSLLKRNELLTI